MKLTSNILLLMILCCLHGCAMLESIGRVNAEKLAGIKRIGIAAVDPSVYAGSGQLLKQVVQTAQSRLPGLTIIPITTPDEDNNILWGEGVGSYWDLDKKAALYKRLQHAALEANLDAIILFRPAVAPGNNNYKAPFPNGFQGIGIQVTDTNETGYTAHVAMSFYAIVFDVKGMDVIGKKNHQTPIIKARVSRIEKPNTIEPSGLEVLVHAAINLITTDLLAQVGLLSQSR